MKPDVAKLRQTILQLAVEGKLTSQTPNDEPVVNLLKRIRNEKSKLLLDGKIRKIKNNIPISNEEKLIKIPMSWAWARLDDISFKITDGSHNPPKKVDYGTNRMLSAVNVSDGEIIFNKYRLISDDGFRLERRRTDVSPNDVLLTIVGTIGRTAVVGDDYNFVLQRSVALIRSGINPNYLSYFFRSSLAQNYFGITSHGVAQQGFYLAKLAKTPLPVPPMDEQIRIVYKVKELMALCDELESKSGNFLFNVSKLRQATLQLAVEGKLTKQDSSDGLVSELIKQINSEKKKFANNGTVRKSQTLPAISKEEKPFNIPESWEWIRLGDATALITDGAHQSPPTISDGLPYITVRDVSAKDTINFASAKKISLKSFRELERTGCKPMPNDVLFSKDGTVGKTAVVPSEPDFVVLSSLAILRPVGNTVDSEFLKYVLKSPMILDSALGMKTGVAIRRVVLVNLKKLPMPLPTYKEQKRIVARVDELMNIFSELESKLGV